MKTPEEKIAELYVLVQDLRGRIPKIEETLSDIQSSIATESANVSFLKSQYDHIVEIVDNIKSISFAVQKLEADGTKFSGQLEKAKSCIGELEAKEKELERYHTDSGWTFERVINIAPNIIAILSFCGYLCYLVLVDKLGL